MLRDDAIREGLLKPTKADKERMGLSKSDAPEPGILDKTGEDEQPAEPGKSTIDDITVAQIKAELDIRGIEYDDKARKAELFELMQTTFKRAQGLRVFGLKPQTSNL